MNLGIIYPEVVIPTGGPHCRRFLPSDAISVIEFILGILVRLKVQGLACTRAAR